jgi:radical SAM superfamily enzyme YgiQ (UPF0313 family)
VTLDVTGDPALVREMALAGCTGVFIGFESLTDQNLADARKRTPRAEDYARRLRIFRDHGIQVNGIFVVGFDGDRKDTFATLVQWIEANRMECATFHILTPYPGTPLFRRLEAEGRLLHRDWEKYDTAHVVFRPKHLTPEELLLGYDWLYRGCFHTDPSGGGGLRSCQRCPLISPAVIFISVRTGCGVFSSNTSLFKPSGGRWWK